MLIAKVQAMLRRTYSFAESTNIIEHNGCILNLTAQNTTGVTDIMEVSPKFLAESWMVYLQIYIRMLSRQEWLLQVN